MSSRSQKDAPERYRERSLCRWCPRTAGLGRSQQVPALLLQLEASAEPGTMQPLALNPHPWPPRWWSTNSVTAFSMSHGFAVVPLPGDEEVGYLVHLVSHPGRDLVGAVLLTEQLDQKLFPLCFYERLVGEKPLSFCITLILRSLPEATTPHSVRAYADLRSDLTADSAFGLNTLV